MFQRAFRSRNYRLFVLGQGTSLIGTWMQQVAMSWLVYRLTGSAMLLGVIGFTSQVPSFFLAPVAGVFADRWEKRRLLLATQSLALVQAAVLAALVLSGLIQIWHLIILSLLLGVVNAFDIPIRQSFVIQMVDHKADLSNAIAINSSIVHAARLIGPTIAGIFVASFGEGVCFAINSASYLAVILALTAMRLSPYELPRQKHHVWHEFREGIRYVFEVRPIRTIIVLLAFISLLGMPYSVLIPVFAKEILHGSSHTYGFLMTATGCGAFLGAIFLAVRKSVVGLGMVIARGPIILGIGIIVFSISDIFFLSMAALVLAGFGAMTMVASCNTILQTLVAENMRGRVMSFFTVAFIGMAPFGSLIVGALAGRIGVKQTVLIGGICCLISALMFLRQLPVLRDAIWPIQDNTSVSEAPGKYGKP